MRYKTTIGILVVLSSGLPIGCSSVHSYTQNSNKSLTIDANRAGGPMWVRNSNRTEVLIIPRPQENEAIILYEPAKGQPMKVKFTKDELTGFAALLETNNAEEVKKVVDSISGTLKGAGVDCCEKRERVSSCEWQCCDGSKCTTCNKTLSKALTYLWPSSRK